MADGKVNGKHSCGKKIEVIKRYNNITDDVNIILKLKLPKIEKNDEHYSAIDMN